MVHVLAKFNRLHISFRIRRALDSSTLHLVEREMQTKQSRNTDIGHERRKDFRLSICTVDWVEKRALF